MVAMRFPRAATAALAAVLLLAPALPAASAAPVVSAEQAEARIGAKLAKRLADARLGRDVSVVVVDKDSGRLVFSSRADERQLPASNMKIVTAVTTLATMPTEHQFPTTVLGTGTPNTIVLRGGGDPLLSRSDLRALAKQAAAGLDPALPVVVQADVSLFGTPVRPQGWPRGYIPSVVSPVTSLAMLWSYSTDPTARAVEAFTQRLGRLGFTVSRGPDTVAAPDAPVLARFDGHRVDDAVELMLRDSENNVAEVLFRQVALAAGQPGTWEGARAAAGAVLGNLGVDASGLALMDGSGLSRSDRLTAVALAGIVRLTRTDPRFAPMYVDAAMPIGGRSGTLDDRFGRFTTKQSRCAAGTVRAKTGTLRDTIGLSGITIGADGQEKVFSILVNDRPQRFSPLATRQAVDGLVATIAGCW